MDIVSHGLWGGLTLGRKNKKSFWTALTFGVAPDLLSFGLFFVSTFLGFTERPNFRSAEPPDPLLVPAYIHTLYDITHSFIPFIILFCIVWYIRKKPLIEMLAWPLHILMDIFTHSTAFFPTPFLWPIIDIQVTVFRGHVR